MIHADQYILAQLRGSQCSGAGNMCVDREL